MRPNDIQVSEHFKLYEFEDRAHDNLVVLHPLLLERLELTRKALCLDAEKDIAIIITSGTRTRRTNNALGKLLGWTSLGGLVCPTSHHLPGYGGLAVDFFALDKSTGAILPMKQVAIQASRFFDTVIDHYPTHLHVDLRHSAKHKATRNA